MRATTVLLLVLLLAGCAPAPPQAAPAAATAPAASASAASEPDDCKTGEDCGWDYTHLVGGKCCDGTCSPKPASKATLERTAARCKTLGWEEAQCPVKKCAELPALACASGKCVVK